MQSYMKRKYASGWLFTRICNNVYSAVFCTPRSILLLGQNIVFSNLFSKAFNPLNAELNAICYLLALLGAHPILHVSRIRINL
jgi:hypothetical protein